MTSPAPGILQRLPNVQQASSPDVTQPQFRRDTPLATETNGAAGQDSNGHASGAFFVSNGSYHNRVFHLNPHVLVIGSSRHVGVQKSDC